MSKLVAILNLLYFSIIYYSLETTTKNSKIMHKVSHPQDMHPTVLFSQIKVVPISP